MNRTTQVRNACPTATKSGQWRFTRGTCFMCDDPGFDWLVVDFLVGISPRGGLWFPLPENVDDSFEKEGSKIPTHCQNAKNADQSWSAQKSWRGTFVLLGKTTVSLKSTAGFFCAMVIGDRRCSPLDPKVGTTGWPVDVDDLIHTHSPKCIFPVDEKHQKQHDPYPFFSFKKKSSFVSAN